MSEENIYFILESENYDDIPYGIAFSDPKVAPEEIQNWNNSKAWQIIKMELKTGTFADYLVNDLAIPLFSEKLKNIIQDFPYEKNYLSWFPIEVHNQETVIIYYYLKLNEILVDTIDYNKSTIENDTIIVPYFIKENTKDVFKIDTDSDYIFISSRLKKRMEKENITGVDYYDWGFQTTNIISGDKPDRESYKTHQGKTYTKEEWEAYEQQLWEKHQKRKK